MTLLLSASTGIRIPVGDDVEYYEEDDWCPDVENCVHPNKVDVDVPEVLPGEENLSDRRKPPVSPTDLISVPCISMSLYSQFDTLSNSGLYREVVFDSAQVVLSSKNFGML